jgi:hypothetical protein
VTQKIWCPSHGKTEGLDPDAEGVRFCARCVQENWYEILQRVRENPRAQKIGLRHLLKRIMRLKRLELEERTLVETDEEDIDE